MCCAGRGVTFAEPGSVREVNPNTSVNRQQAADVAASRRKGFATSEDEFETAGEESDEEVTPAPRRAPVSAELSVSSPFSSNYSASTSSPHSFRRSDLRLGRRDSTASAPPSSEWLTREPPMRVDSRRVSDCGIFFADVAAIASFKASAPVSADPPPPRIKRRSTKSQSVRPTRAPVLNARPRPFRALFCLKLSNPLRSMCIKIVEFKYPFMALDYKGSSSSL